GIRERNVTGVQPCALPIEEDVGGFRTDLRIGAAHDAGDALRPVLTVDYQEVLGGQRTFGAVEGGDPLPLASVPHPEARTSQAGGSEERRVRAACDVRV